MSEPVWLREIPGEKRETVKQQLRGMVIPDAEPDDVNAAVRAVWEYGKKKSTERQKAWRERKKDE